MPRRDLVFGAFLLIALCTIAVSRGAMDEQLRRWEPHDFTFKCKAEPAAPFNVALTADLIGPNWLKLHLPGFYDGASTWKIRLSVPIEGNWSLTTHCDVAELNDQRFTFRCTGNPSPLIHGGMRIDREHPHQFAWEDGAHFLPVGYECDWLWALDANDPKLPTINSFLDKLTASGFDLIVLDTYAYDTTWRKGKTGKDDFGPPPMLPWEGTNDKPAYARFNLSYWQHFDRVMNAMYQRGIVAHLLMRVYNKGVQWPANGSLEDDLYFRWLIARYAAYPNVTWDLSKEAQYEKDLNYKINRLKFIRDNDPYHRLLTLHDDHANYARGVYNGLLDFRSDQQHTLWRETMLDHLRARDWPVINTEFGYEHGPGGLQDKTYNRAQSAEEVCRRAWVIYTAGGFGVYYYTYTAWDVIRPRDTPPGYAYFKHLRDFFEGTHYWRLLPTDGVSSDGYCLADPGHEYVVFLNKAQPLSLKLQALPVPLKAEWYQPYTGDKRAGETIRGGTVDLKPPADWVDVPIALHVGVSN